MSTLRATDRWLLVLTLALLCAGLAMVLSASSVEGLLAYDTAYYYFGRQLVFAVAGLIAMFLLQRTDYRRLHRWAPAAAVVAVVLMLLVLVPHVGRDPQLTHGAARWIELGPATFQPSELAKLALAVYVAQWVDRRQGRLRSFSDGFMPFAIMLAGLLGILLLQRDLGTAVVMCAILVSIFFVGGGRKAHVALLLGGLLAAFALFVVLESYRQQRLTTFLDPFKDPLGASYQPVQALIGLGSGGPFGIGLGHSVLKYGWLPEAHTDFIFAVIGEEIGLVGTTLVLAAFVVLTVRGCRAAMRAPDRFGVMLATGITTWIGFQALVNMATVTSTLPATGVPLPFISYGGSALAITLAAMGVLLNVAAQARDEPDSRRTDATADRGRRNWRTPFAGSRRGADIARRAAGG
ncbi:MAG TPA: putative lipid II flippase FtsW [Candidatus Dormibacteraeota bacterium]